jgi:hypothetical protein
VKTIAPPEYFGQPVTLVGYFKPATSSERIMPSTKSAIPSDLHLRDAVRGQRVPGAKVMKLPIAIIAALLGVEFSLMFLSRRTSRRELAPNAPPRSPSTPDAVSALACLFYADPKFVAKSTNQSCFFSDDIN